MAVNKKQPPNGNLPPNGNQLNRITIDATVITGALIFLTISSVGIVIPSDIVTAKTDIALLYKALTATFAFIIIVPFSADALAALYKPTSRRIGMGAGFVVIPLIIGFLALVYLFTSLGWVPTYIPVPTK